MEWKDFFRPNKYNINISIVIIFLGIALSLIQSAIAEAGCRSWSCYSPGYKILTIILTSIALPSAILDIVLPNLKINFFIWIIALIISLGYIYVISCIITYFSVRKK